jgi:rhamnosyltransferase
MTMINLYIPTLNAGEKWIEVLESIKMQSIVIQQKIIVDSGSTDDTVKLALSFGFKVTTIKKSEFNHGATRQLLIDMDPKCEIAVFLTQDAILANEDSISNLVKGFVDPDIALAYGRQLPHTNARPLEIHARLFNYPAENSVRSFADKNGMGFKVFFCSNSFAAYRVATLKSINGFPSESIMGEDAIVAAKLLLENFKIAYIANATVRHSHSYTFVEEFRRYFDTRVFHEQNAWLIDKYGKPTGEGIKYVKSELRFVLKNSPSSIFKLFISVLGKWLGYKSGQFYKRIPRSLLTKVSMHKHYWK